MYGFESTVLLAWQSGAAFDAGRPFFPADIVAALAASPDPTVLVTTPFHLHAILESRLSLPLIELVICATAPLSAQLAARAEAAFHAPLLEIYGSTETGQLATRRTCSDEAWTLFPEIRLEEQAGQTWAEGGHIEVRVPLGDIIERLDGRRFLLKGRHTDLINIAGKRTSLGWLNQQLLSIAGVTDGGFYLPECPCGGQDAAITRLTAFVVAPELDNEQLLAALRERVDPIFLPRPLILVDTLPRTAVGKLPRAACEALLARHSQGQESGHEPRDSL
jgi:acyl-coenzyme A synthetase/AMP-(fatty) acid ligase